MDSIDLGAKGYQERERSIRENMSMKREYDFSKAERGKFFREGAELQLPIYLDRDLRSQLEQIALKSGRDVSDVVNQLLRMEVDLLREFAA